MKEKIDLRIKDNPEIWKNVPADAATAFEYLYEKLIVENKKLWAFALEMDCGPSDEPVRDRVRPAQQVVLLLFKLDAEILNGGVTQFAWNSPLEIEDAVDAIDELKVKALGSDYKKVVQRIMDKSNEWLSLKKKWNQKPDWKHFQDSYAVLQLEWFDEIYMAKHRQEMLKALVELVLANKRDFVF